MAITILNEWEYDDGWGIISDIVSVFSKLNLYYKATITSVDYSEVTISNSTTSNSITFRAIEVDEDASFKYYVIIGEEFFKFWYYNQGGEDMPSFKSSYTGTFFSTLFTQDVDINISTYTSADALIEDDDFENVLGPLGCKFPNISGFNLYEFYGLRHIKPLKWSNDTFNEIILYSASDSTNIKIENLTTGKEIYNTTTPDGTKTTKALYFGKKKRNILPPNPLNANYIKPHDSTGVKNIDLGTYDYDEITGVFINYNKTIFSDDGSTNNRDELIFTYSAIPTETYTVTQQKNGIVNNITFNKNHTATSGTVTITLKIDNADAYLNEHVSVSDNIALGIFTPEYDETILANGLNKIEIQHSFFGINRIIDIDYNFEGCYVNVLFNHPTIGYVSYPFEGMKIETEGDSKGDSINIFNETLIGVNKLKELQSITSTVNISVSSQVESKYWDIVKEIYNARHVFLFVGDDGAMDSEENWLSCEISGTPNINYNKNKSSALFTINLTLPDKFNNKL